MAGFRQTLSALGGRVEQPGARVTADGRSWVYVPYDQLTDEVGPLAAAPPQELGIVLVETTHKASQRPYHKAKLVLVLSNMRHFALEQARRGVAVLYLVGHQSYRDMLAPVVDQLGEVSMMMPAERELAMELGLLDNRSSPIDGLRVVPHEGWLSTVEDFRASQPDTGRFRMDAFYRHMRRKTGLLMEDDRPLGGKFSHDADNRQPWSGEPAAPDPPRFEVDAVTREVVALVEDQFASHPGSLDPGSLPTTAEDAQRLWTWALDHCMTHFGPYEDAMSSRSRGLFHTRISPLLNLQRLLPRRVVHDVARLGDSAPLSSREGFVRQVLGWREFVRHVHRETDGFAELENPTSAERPLPAAFWGSPSGLRCLDQVVEEVWEDGWSHHITRLMVLCNIASLLDVSPREVNHWFWVAYIDAYDWVVEPNVLGMGTFAAGELMTSKPYISGAAYINKMSDYCKDCAFDPKKTCPITSMYWAYLNRHNEALRSVNRIRLQLASASKRTEDKRERDQRVYERVGEILDAGEVCTPEHLDDLS